MLLAHPLIGYLEITRFSFEVLSLYMAFQLVGDVIFLTYKIALANSKTKFFAYSPI